MNSSISGVTFAPEKEFFKLLFGVKVTPQKITPVQGVKLAVISPTTGVIIILENYCVTTPCYAQFTGRYCGKTLPSIGTSLSQSLYVTFHSDELGAFEGFKAEFSGVKGTLILCLRTSSPGGFRPATRVPQRACS